MYLKQLLVINFKSILQAEFEFSSKINCFVGLNGVGKTNLLDAIYYLSFTKSNFNPADIQNINHNQDFFVVQGEYFIDDVNELVYCGLKRGKNKIFKRNQKEYEKLTDHIGLIPLVMISPYDNRLILDGSEERRKFIDGVISQYDRIYLHNLIQYNRILAQRNALLKNFAVKNNFDSEILELWNDQLVNYGNLIYNKRKQFINEIIPLFKLFYTSISGGHEAVDLLYSSQLHENEFGFLLSKAIEKDRILEYTSVGIHKDDLNFTLSEHPLKKIGSQGQQKTFLIALKLAQYDFIKKHVNQNPLILLDDIFDKLDATRVEQIIKLVSENHFGQTFITHTNLDRMEDLLARINIEHKVFEIK